MANNSVSLTSLDFDTLKSNFIAYLSGQSVFKDYNFNDSNINVLLDILSYNTYLNSFYLNMVGSEMFLDSAQKTDSIVSHAKELNYLPRSAKSAVASINFTVNATPINGILSIPAGTIFSGQNSNGLFTFTTNITQNYTSSNSTYNINNLQIYEGSYFQDSFVVDYTQEQQIFVLSNPNIDTDSISVIATESGSNTTFLPVETTFNLSNTSNVYFLQAAQNGQYEVVFGDGILGRIPDNLSLVTVKYRVTNGDAAVGVSSFILVQDLSTVPGNGSGVLASPITTIANSAGGSSIETPESIRKFAPRYFATQQRAVASDDFSSLILANFSSQIADVNVYGGELLTPKQYGRVAICLKPTNGIVAPDYVKNEIQNYLLNYNSLPTRTIITDPDYIYLNIQATVQYDQTQTTKLPIEIQSIISNSITEYGIANLEDFKANFRYSKFVAAIDSIDSSIVSNATEILLTKKINPLLNYATSYILDYNNPANMEQPQPLIGYNAYKPFADEPIVTSTSFTYVDSNNNQFPLSYIRDDNTGNLVVYTDINGIFTVINPSLGAINYSTGIITINNLKVSNYTNNISIYMSPLNDDVVVDKDKIIFIDPVDVSVTIEQVVK